MARTATALATTGYIRQHGLTLEQENAIELLVAGKTDRETADAVGVHRVTVTKWRHYDPLFQAELNRSRHDLWAGSIDRLRGLLPRAFDALERALEGDQGWRVALKLVELVGTPPGQRHLSEYLIGPEDPTEVLDAAVRQRRGSPDALLSELIVGGGVTERERAVLASEWGTRLEDTVQT